MPAAGADPQGAYVPGHPETSAPPRSGGMQTQLAAAQPAAPAPATTTVEEDYAFIADRIRTASDTMRRITAMQNAFGSPNSTQVCSTLMTTDTAYKDIIRRIASMRNKPVSADQRQELSDLDVQVRDARGHEVWDTFRRFSCKWTYIHGSDLPRWQGLHLTTTRRS